MNTETQRTSPAVEKLRASLHALPRRDIGKVARFAGLSGRGVELFAAGSTVVPGATTLAAMQSGLARFVRYSAKREKMREEFPELAGDEE